MIATVLISMGLLALVGTILFRMIRKWRSGQSVTCGGSCSGCGGQPVCHQQEVSGQPVHWHRHHGHGQ